MHPPIIPNPTPSKQPLQIRIPPHKLHQLLNTNGLLPTPPPIPNLPILQILIHMTQHRIQSIQIRIVLLYQLREKMPGQPIFGTLHPIPPLLLNPQLLERGFCSMGGLLWVVQVGEVSLGWGGSVGAGGESGGGGGG